MNYTSFFTRECHFLIAHRGGYELPKNLDLERIHRLPPEAVYPRVRPQR
jgi:hypothetical protein